MVSKIFDVCAREMGVVHIPLFRERKDDPLAEPGTQLFSADGTHPNDEGYARWYDSIRSGVMPHLKEYRI